MSVTLKGMTWALWLRRKRVPLGLGSQLQEETETCYIPESNIYIPDVHSISVPGAAAMEG